MTCLLRGTASRFASVMAVTLLLAASAARAEQAKVEGLWKLDEKASRNVPASAKGIELKISIQGSNVIVERQIEGARVGEPLAVSLQGTPTTRDFGGGQTGTIEARWRKVGTEFEQIVKLKAAKGMLPTTQTTVTTATEDGSMLTQVKTRVSAGDSDVSTLVFRKKG